MTAAQLKTALAITNATMDTTIAFAITAASRAIDAYTERQFGVLATAAARVYQAHYDPDRYRYVASIDDLQTTTSLVVKTNDADTDTAFGNTLTINTHFRLEPFNAAADGTPWTGIVNVPGSALPLQTRERSIEITALWGWTAVPVTVTQAALLQASRLLKRREAPFGVAGSAELGSQLRLLSRLDPDVQVLLAPLRRLWGAK